MAGGQLRAIPILYTGLVMAGMIAAMLISHELVTSASAQTVGSPPAVSPAKMPSQITTLPGGATSLQESYQDWSVTCALQNGTKRCAMSQQQQNPQTRQRVLGIELAGLAADHADGILILPFGLSFDVGVTLQIDDGVAIGPLRFRTCLPAGCIVPINFDAHMLSMLRRSAILTVKATADGAGETPFAISLKGFGSAFDRTLSLSR